MQLTTMPKYIPWGQDPEPGMILMGFSCDAVLEGAELKNQLIERLRRGDVGFREAVEFFKQQGGATFDQALFVVRKMKKDLEHKKNKKDTSSVMKNYYKYTINRVFWAYEKDMPKDDPRYFKLQVIDCQDIDKDKYENPDRSFNVTGFIKDYISDKDLNKIKKQKKVFSLQENAPENEKTGNNIDATWNVPKK